MRAWLTIDLVLGTLLVASFTCVGVLALWAAASPCHWFIRATVVLVALSPMLLVPAYEPIVAFALQCLVVACGVFAYRWRLDSHLDKDHQNPNGQLRRPSGFRFSLSSFLLLVVFAAVAIAIIVRLPPLNLYAWSSVVAVGALCGVATLIAAWMFASSRKWLAWPIGLILCAGLGAILWGLDWFAYSIVKQLDWPPAGPSSIANRMLGTREPPVLVWLVALPAISALVNLLLLLWSVAFAGARVERQKASGRYRVGRIAAAASLSILFLVLAGFPLFILFQLMHPLPVPSQQLPTPNGYDELVAAGKILGSSPILNTSVDPASTDVLAAEVAKFATVLAQVRQALSRPIEAPVWPIDKKTPIIAMSFADIQTVRAVARALMREAELAQQQGRFRDAAMISVDNMRIGRASSRGGLIIHYLVGVAMEGIGQWTLYPAIAHLDAAACRETLTALEQADQHREPLDAVFHRDRIYSQHVWGWYGHLLVLLHDMSESYREAHWATRQASTRSTALARLLRMVLALRCYRLQNDCFPDRLETLVPEYASNMPADPYDALGRSLRYVPTSDGYLLYSVGFDGDDDGGRPSPRDSGLLDDGDIRVDSYFAPDEEATVAAENDQESNTGNTEADDAADDDGRQ
jgi:hypothetical protein